MHIEKTRHGQWKRQHLPHGDIQEKRREYGGAYEVPAAYRDAETLIANYPTPAPEGKLRPWETVVLYRR